MPNIIFILMIAVPSRILYLKKYPVENFLSEIKYVYAIFMFEVVWFMICHFIFRINFVGFPFR